jgi:hypothetical protein
MRITALLFIAIVTAVSANGQCYPDRHNTSWNEGWISCETRESPNPERGSGHWIMYDFGYTYAMGKIHVWNYNAADWINMGMREIQIDYSLDGNSWKTLGAYVLEQASGMSTYEGYDVANFMGDTARYVLITAVDNYGGSCTGLSEIKIDVSENVAQLFSMTYNDCFDVAVYPNPHQEQFTFRFSSKCKGIMEYSLYEHTGKLILQGQAGADDANIQLNISTGSLSTGLYHLIVRQSGKIGRYPVVKMQP